MSYKLVPTIGIEVHVQFNTKTKLFAAVDNDAIDAKPNTLVSPVCFGLPGALPVLNQAAVSTAVKAGLAMNAKINLRSQFDRKHYFYPDLPLGYQITQLYDKIIGEGFVEITIAGQTRKIGIEGAHLEADAGKSTHPAGTDYSLVDLNRAGTPLLEIVSKPDIHSAAEARAYVSELYLLMKYAGVSNVDLFRGNMRFDVNISVAEEGAKELGKRAEVKNLNSFKAVEKATEYEIKRQSDLVEAGETVVQETRGWDDNQQQTFSQRSKEDAHDYRYFPEPDLPPIVLTSAEVNEIKTQMPQLPPAIRKSLVTQGLSVENIEILLLHKPLIDIVLNVAEHSSPEVLKRAVNWFVSDLLAEVSDDFDWRAFKLSRQQLEELSQLVDEDQLSSSGAKQVFMIMYQTTDSPSVIAEQKKLTQVSDDKAIAAIVDQVIADNEKAVTDIKSGNDSAIGFLVGQVMQQSKGQANPKLAQKIIKEKLK